MTMSHDEIKRVLRWIRADAIARKLSGYSTMAPLPIESRALAFDSLSVKAPPELVEFYAACDGIWFNSFQIKSACELHEEVDLGWISIRDHGNGGVDCIRADDGPDYGTIWMCAHDPDRKVLIAPSLATWLAMIYLEFRDRGSVGDDSGAGVYLDAP